MLIDEYDAPLLDVVHGDRGLDELRYVVRYFYSPLIDCEPILRFVFMTGITKFPQLSIFCELNNVKNISMDEPYAWICGITEDGLLMQMSEDIDDLSGALGQDSTIGKLKEHYDGYHFTWPSPDVYNPYSLLNSFADGKIASYWFGSGTPMYLINMMRKFKVLPSQISGVRAKASSFDAATETMTSMTPLLYQSGYVSIKDYEEGTGVYTLYICNKEIYIGLFDSLLPGYLASASDDGMVRWSWTTCPRC